MTDDDTLADELRVLMARAGIVVPADRLAGVLAGYADVVRMAALLRQPRTAESEPAAIFSMTAVVRSAGAE